SLWVTTLDGDMICRDFRTTSDGGYVLVGIIVVWPGMTTDLKLFKLDMNGLVVWQQTFQSPWGAAIGTSIIETIDGGYTIGVGTSTAGQSLSSELHSYLLKTDAGGDSLWSIFLENIAATAILETTSDCYAIAGVTDPEGSSDRALNLLQLDDSQAVQWSKSWDIGEYEFPSELLRTFDGGFAIGGSIMSNLEQQDLFLLKTNSEGDLQWQRFYHDDDLNYIRGCFLMDDGGYAFAGSSTPSDYTDTQALAIRTNSMGFELWRYRSDYGNIQVYDACTAPDGGIVFTGINNGESWLMKLEGE
ncbi:hypothetical protein KKA08_02815, partial [bacterium]|nr:hypothetical protein [bacterium]